MADEKNIKVRDFAKLSLAHFAQPKNNNETKSDASVNLLPVDIETISLSSEDDKKPINKKRPVKRLQIPKLSGNITRSSAKKRRKNKFTLQEKYHKIDKYFLATKTDCVSYQLKENARKEIQPEEKSNIKSCVSNLRQIKLVLRRLSIDQNVELSKTRKVQDQSKMPDFIEYKSLGTKYFTVHSSSALVESNHNEHTEVPSVSNDGVSAENHIKKCEHGITQRSTNFGQAETFRIPNKLSNKKKASVKCPDYKIIEETKLAVDAFRYGNIDGVKHYFLSHFHADHYIGLKKSFNQNLYLSNITGRLVREIIKVETRYIRCLDINSPIIVDEVEVTALDANHCPGAVMFLFKLKSGKCILHTGDFRASPDMEEYPELWNNEIHTIYLDTTYLSTKYKFCSQSDSISFIIQYCREFISSCVSSGAKHLIICGAYKIGKEKVWLRIAQEFSYKVWVDKNRNKVLQCIQNDEISEALTPYVKDASIHILPLGNISYQFISDYIQQFGETYCKVLAIRPSGWENKKSKPNFSNRISILGAQYSEHSSYNELERFVRFLSPQNVISTVPISSKNVTKTPEIPKSWLIGKIQPMPRSYQQNITDFFTKEQK